MSLPMSLVEAARKKRPVFTVSAGRSGTKFLAKLLGLFPDTAAHHEPSPSFVHGMRHAQSNPEAALAFVRDHKLGAIARTSDRLPVAAIAETCGKSVVRAPTSSPAVRTPCSASEW